ncbi:hypothetical protein [Streptacidiphilus sp. EB129]|jgi:putative Mg2+ transporter-C (MgtC) family protein|uniref:hypothetical protein n=1 Tax=Streptacidiphilus sp. EB129 TaxID=3156262 RepID=UPI003510FBF3
MSHRTVSGLLGDPAHALERLITRLSLEPGIGDLRRHLDEGDGDGEREAMA